MNVSTLTPDFEVDIPSLRGAMGLTHTEARVLAILLKEEIATHEQLTIVNYRVRQLMYNLRIKLRKKGVFVMNDRDIGYSIPLKHKLHIMNIINGEIEVELDKANKISRKYDPSWNIVWKKVYGDINE